MKIGAKNPIGAAALTGVMGACPTDFMKAKIREPPKVVDLGLGGKIIPQNTDGSQITVSGLDKLYSYYLSKSGK